MNIPLEVRIEAFVALGKKLTQLNEQEIENLTESAKQENPWFTQKSVRTALRGATYLLEETNFRKWANRYSIQVGSPQKIGVIMAGNIPLVGLHDAICVLLSGHQLLARPSQQDSLLIKKILGWLIEIENTFSPFIQFVEQLKEADAVIATGSDNSARYFTYYFGKKPHIIRKNRVSCAVIKGDEPNDDFQKLSDDILLYFGLGCRNVSKVFVPEGFSMSNLLDGAKEKTDEVIQHHKYMNNYDYNKAIYLVNQTPHLDNGGLLAIESPQLVSPISVLFYETYPSEETLKNVLESQQEKIQCTVSHNGWWPNSLHFGQAQFPEIDDYADGVDTLNFLLSL